MKKFLSLILAVLMTASAVSFSAYAGSKNEFEDVSGKEYFAEAVEALSELDILNGYEDGTFKAENNVTRAEMAAVIVRMMGLEDEADGKKGTTAFDDVEKGHWASGYINLAVQEGIINGDGDGKFRPSDEVKHEEAIKMVVCAEGLGDDVKSSGSDWAAPYLNIAKENGISDGVESKKGGFATRGDVAVMVYNGLGVNLEAPGFSLKAGNHTGNQTVTITTEANGAEIYYTTDGSNPTTESTLYKEPVVISKTSTLKAIAVKHGMFASDITEAKYVISQPIPGGGSSSVTKYTVSFNLNYDGADKDDAPESQKVKKGKTAQEPEKPERDGYTFECWSTSKDGEEEFNFSTAIKKTTKLYAIWKEDYIEEEETEEETEEDSEETEEEIEEKTEEEQEEPVETEKFSVTFYLGFKGATEAYEEQAVTKGENAAAPSIPTREGYEFIGWTVNKDTEEEFDFETEITEDVVLYAMWQELEIVSIELSAGETSAFTGIEKNVCFYAKVKNNNNTVKSVNLANESGDIVAKMYDDGKYSENGDELSNDDIFTCVIKMDVSDAAKFTYTAVGTGDDDLYESNGVTVAVYESITPEQLEKMSVADNTIQNDIFSAENYEALTSQERKELADNVINEMVGDSLIQENTVYYDEENGMYTFKYDSGAFGAIVIKDWNAEQNGIENTENTPTGSMENENTIWAERMAAAEMSSNSATLASNEDEEEEEKVIVDADAVILWSFNQAWDDESYRKPFYKQIESEWEEVGLDTTVIWQTSIEDYKKLDEYEVIVFSGHGAYLTYYADAMSSKVTSSLLLNENSNKKKDEQYKNDLRMFNIGKISIQGGTKYAILPGFWETYYEEGDFDNAFVFAENCEFYGKNGNVNYAFSDALTGLAAESVIGFHNSVMATYSRNFMKEYVNGLVDGKTTYEAFEAAKEKYGANDYFKGREIYGLTAYPIFRGTKESKLVTTDFKNGSFEDEIVFNGWKKKGDVRVISKLGALIPRHKNNMAILTTGIGSGTSDYKEATEGSVLYQTFNVPKNAKTISFEYNFVSEEPMEYVGSKFDDKFFVEIVTVDKNNTTDTVVSESINTSTWISISDIDFDGGDKTAYHTGWKTVSFNMEAYQGKTVTLRFVVYDVGDSIYDTATLVDNIVIK